MYNDILRAVPENYPQGGGRQNWLLHPQDMRTGTNAHPQDKSEYQLPPPHLTQDKLEVIMHSPSGQKKQLPPTPAPRG